MDSFKKITSIVTPLDKVNVDTDQIVPKQFLKLVQKSGFGKFLFFNWRYDEQENEKSDFILNNPKYENSQILVAGDNFGEIILAVVLVVNMLFGPYLIMDLL